MKSCYVNTNYVGGDDDDDNNNVSINFAVFGVNYSRVSAVTVIIAHKMRFNGEHVCAFHQKRKQNMKMTIKSGANVVDTDVSGSRLHALRVVYIYRGDW